MKGKLTTADELMLTAARALIVIGSAADRLSKAAFHKASEYADYLTAWCQARDAAKAAKSAWPKDEAQGLSFAQYEHAHRLRLIGEFFWLQGRRR